jgi:hypothetical protein
MQGRFLVINRPITLLMTGPMTPLIDVLKNNTRLAQASARSSVAFPAVRQSASLPLQQSVINTDIGTFQHLGCVDRLAGPVDNPQSSCTSCHASAYAAPKGAPGIMGSNVPPSFGFAGMCQAYSLENSSYFQNQSTPQRFPGGQYGDAFTMDTSLQLEVAFTQYGYFNTDHGPQACTNPNQITPRFAAAKAALHKKVSK